MATAPQQQQSQAEKAEIKLGQEQTAEARAKSAPLQTAYQSKMNRDDSGRMTGMASADVMQSSGTNRSGQMLASGKGGGFGSTGLGSQLQQATDNASMAALGRQDGLKSGYNDLGNKKNVDASLSQGALASASSQIARAEADASAKRQNAMFEGAVSLGGAAGLGMYDKYDMKDMSYQRQRKSLRGKGSPFNHDGSLSNESEVKKALSLRDIRNKSPGAKFFNKLGSW